MQHDGHGHADRNDGQHQHVERQSAATERGEKAGTYLKTDGIDEENEAELLQEVEQMLIQIETEMAEHQTDEQHPGESQRDVGHLDLAQCQSQGYDQRQDHDGMSGSAAP